MTALYNLPLMPIAPGYIVRIKYGPKHPNNKVQHIRAIVDGCMVVSRTWSKRNQTWIYDVAHVYRIGFQMEHGVATVEREKEG